MKYKCLIFDLDGTLVNSIHALTYCTNLALEKFGLSPLTETQMKTIVGDGYKMQMKRSLAACGDTDEAHYEAILPVYMEIFGKYCNYEMQPYDGIMELTARAKELGLKIAVVSNKPDAQAKKTVEYVFGTNYFDTVIGEQEGVPKKPDPSGALKAAKLCGADPSECLYFGDTNTDMKTGKNAKMTTVGVLWGFRGREELAAFHPEFLLEKPPPFVAEYAASQDAPQTPQTEEILMILPLWLWIMPGIASFAQWKTEERFAETIRFQSSKLKSCKSPMMEIPALFTRTST